MNIKITYNWLLEYLDTAATPEELQRCLSLSGPSIERMHQVGDDTVFDIEITSNRIDMASVFGVAQEAAAILPQHGIPAKLRANPLDTYTFANLQAKPSTRKLLTVKTDASLNPRFTAAVFSNLSMGPSPDIIASRLTTVDIQPINLIIDISNYVMVALGQPVHMFDYDSIGASTLTLRESRKGEKMTTLDGKTFTLSGGDIVIEDGHKKLIDLCGIMGGKNSSITPETQQVVLFVQTYDKRKIRRTSMTTGQRTIAATYFEKGLDPERVESAFCYATSLILAQTESMIDSEIIDIYPHKRHPKKVHTYLTDIQRVMGIPIHEKTVHDILSHLGFGVTMHLEEEMAYPDNVKFTITVPTYRIDDVQIKEDIAEEVARVYGYGNLPNEISPMIYLKQPIEIERLFALQTRVKYFMKSIGLTESLHYSLISKKIITELELDESEHLKLANTISSEIEYLRTSLAPSLILTMKKNQGKREAMRLFEIAKVYESIPDDLPKETYHIAIAVDTSDKDIKGIVDALCTFLHIPEPRFGNITQSLLDPSIQMGYFPENSDSNEAYGYLGQLNAALQHRVGLTKSIFLAEFTFDWIVQNARTVEPYIKPASYAVVKLDLTLQRRLRTFQHIKRIAQASSPLLIQVEFLSEYDDKITIRCYFSSTERNLTESEAKEALQTIDQALG